MAKVAKTKPTEGTHNYEYTDRNGAHKYITLEPQIYNIFQQQEADYTASKNYIESTWLHIWNKAVKSYLMYTGDRERYIKDWQSNIHLGMIREKIDVYISFLEDVPMQFILNGLDKLAFESPRIDQPELSRLDFARNTVQYIADITKFSDEAAMGLIEGMQMGTAILKTRYSDEGDSELKLPALINGEFVDVTYKPRKLVTPISESLDIYHVFPDPFSGRLPRYVTERNVVKISTFMETFGGMIFSDDNKIKLRKEEVSEILTNRNKADYKDFGNIRDEIYKKMNTNYSKSCSLYKNNRPTSTGTTVSEEEARETEKVEYKLTTYEDRIVLSGNGYPLYMGDNKDGRILYKFTTAYRSRGLYTESPAILLSGLEDIQASFFNNYVDNARGAAQNRWIASRSDFEGTPDIEDLPPNGVLWADRATENTFRPLPQQQVTDYGIMNITAGFAQGLLGVSEIDSGRASKLRVAAEGASLAGATNRRLNGYIKRYMNGISEVGSDWLLLHQKKLAALGGDEWIFTKDIDGNVKTFDINAKDLEGSYHVTLDTQGFFAMNKESALQKKMDMYNVFKGDLEAPERKKLIQSIFREAGLNPSIYMPDAASLQAKPAEPTIAENIPLYGDTPPEQIAGQEMAAAMNTQLDMGNGGEGAPPL